MSGLSPPAQRLRVQLSILTARNNGRPLPPWMVEEAARAVGLGPQTADAALREIERAGFYQWTAQGWSPRPTVAVRGHADPLSLRVEF